MALLGLVIPGWPGRLVTMVMFGAAAFHRPRRPWLVMSLSIAWMLIPQTYRGLSVATDLVIMGVAPVGEHLATRHDAFQKRPSRKSEGRMPWRR